MKRILKSALVALLVMFVCFGCVPIQTLAEGQSSSGGTSNENGLLIAGNPTSQNSTDKTIDILFTHDLHCHVKPVKETKDGNIVESGGFARLKTILDKKRSENPNTITLDAGDFTSGSLYETLFTSKAAELRLLGDMGYDAVTVGNHEFDFTEQGFASMMDNAKKSGDTLPQFVMSNYNLKTNENGELSNYAKNIKTSLDNYPVKDYTVINKNGVKVAVFGLLGKDAVSDVTTFKEMQIEDNVTASKRIVKKIKENEDVDMILCLSHSGTNSDPGKSEDETLAKQVPEIDVIVSGHTHTTFNEPKVVGNTYIVCCGCYCQNLGELNLTKANDGTWKMNKYNVIPVTGDTADDPYIVNRINYFSGLIQNDYLSRYGYKTDDVLGFSPFSFSNITDMGKGVKEEPLGTLLADSYRYVSDKFNKDNEKSDIAVIPSGTTRASLVKGNITVEDVFNINPLGTGTDGTPGYPIIELYVRGDDLKSICEIDASVASMSSDVNLSFSGLSYTYNPNRLILDKVTDVKIKHNDGSLENVDNNKLYKCVAGIYSAQALSKVNNLSKGLLTITIRDKNGNEVTPDHYKDHVLRDNGNEVKEWQALAVYLQSLEKKRKWNTHSTTVL
eukprot:TRINITY_DN9434_c0_g1_i4.p1 TRINITY_DN9434_c0_g1~~TRINITY_DN9434_c0_g1_i4.p1  ORF type:complete len:616 (-),score=-84.50 TRINITY_DN9434_c0_g1_i4:271-2118(-)